MVLLVTLALYVVIGRQLWPAVEAYRVELQDYLSALTGYRVRIGRLKGSWDGFDPQVVLQDVVLTQRDPATDTSASNDAVSVNSASALSVKQFFIQLSVVDSLISGKVQFKQVETRGLSLRLSQGDEGGWTLAGGRLPAKSEKSPPVSDLEALLAWVDQPSLQASDVDLYVSSRHGTEAQWRIPQAYMLFENGLLRASGELLVPGHEKPFLRFSVKGTDRIFSAGFSGKLWIEWLSGEFLDDFIDAYSWNGLSLTGVEAKGQAWLDFYGGRPVTVQGDIALDAVRWKNETGVIAPLEAVHAAFFWAGSEKNSRLQISDLRMRWNENEWRPTSVMFHSDANGYLIEGDHLNVSFLTSILSELKVFPSTAQTALQNYSPAGQINHWKLSIPSSDDAAVTQSSFQFDANFEQLSVHAVSGAPSAENLKGYLSLTNRQGKVLVDNDNVSLAFPNLYKSGWTFERAQLEVDWRVEDLETIIESKGIRLYWQDQAVVFGDFVTKLNGPSHEDTLLLKIAVSHAAATQASQLTPYHSVGEGLWTWLDTALTSGRVNDGFYLGYGSIEDNAPDNSFTSAMYFNVEDVELAFDPSWPAVQHFTGRVEIHDSHVEVAGPQAELAGMAIKNVDVQLPSEKGEGWLGISADITPTAENLHWWLASSPVSAATSKLDSQLRVDGSFSGEVKLNVPLFESEASPDYDIKLQMHDALVEHRSTGLTFEHVAGGLSVSSATGVSASNVSLRFLDRPATLVIKTLSEHQNGESNPVSGSDETLTQLTLETQMLVEDAQALAGLQGDYGLTGSFPVEAELRIYDSADRAQELHLRSSLQGMASSLPPPFRKDADEVWHLSGTTEVSEAGVVTRIALNDLIRADLQWSQQDFTGGRIYIGDRLSSIEQEGDPLPGVRIRGQFEDLESDPWIAFFANAPWLSGDILPDHAAFKALDVSIEASRLGFHDIEMNDVELQLFQQLDNNASRWALNANAQQLAGKILFPTADLPLVVELDRLDLDKYLGLPSAAQNTAPNSLVPTRFSPSDLVEMDVSINHLNVKGSDLGRWSASIRKEENGISIQDIKGAIASEDGVVANQFDGHISWLEEPSGQQTTLLSGTAEGKNLGDFNRLSGKAESIRTESYTANMALVWAGDPLSMALKKLSGTVSLKTGKGLVPESKEAAEAFKVFGVLNADSITRRLQLDFSDLYEKGVSFDQIEGKARLEHGTLFLESPLAIQGTTIGFKFTGNAYLDDETLDMDMVVVLPLTKNLPLAALLLGAPQVGGALWLIDKLIGEPLSRLTSATYHLSGSINNPELKLKNVFDRSKSKARKDK